MNETADTLLPVALAAIERKYGCRICFHDYTGLIARIVPEMSHFHTNAFCSGLKERHPRFTPTCIAFDRDTVQRRIAGITEPFFKYCPCGLLEAVIPVQVHGKLSGAMFAGPFRLRGKLPPGTLKCGKTADFPELDDAKAGLPELTPEDMVGLPALCRLVAGRISQRAETIDAVDQGSGNRKDQIRAFLSHNFKNNIGLPDLAGHLGLSVSRTSQLVKLLYGSGFSELLNRERLEHAAALLRNSQFKIITVARLCGFHDPAYFHRVFHRFAGMSPLVYRRRQADSLVTEVS